MDKKSAIMKERTEAEGTVNNFNRKALSDNIDEWALSVSIGFKNSMIRI